jgi:hypothetical protein
VTSYLKIQTHFLTVRQQDEELQHNCKYHSTMLRVNRISMTRIFLKGKW